MNDLSTIVRIKTTFKQLGREPGCLKHAEKENSSITQPKHFATKFKYCQRCSTVICGDFSLCKSGYGKYRNVVIFIL